MEIAETESLDAANVFRKEIHSGMTDALRLISETLDKNFVQSLELEQQFRLAMQLHREALNTPNAVAPRRD